MLELKQTQKLIPILTQQLQQAIKLLQLSRLELMEAIEQELKENPVLEVKESEDIEEPSELPGEESEDIAEFLERFSPSEGIITREEREYPDYENIVKKTYNLRDYLRWQVGVSDFDSHERVAAEWVIENIDDNGYLAYSLDEIAKTSGFPLETLEKILRKIQKLDPTGVGARNLQECILIQYEAQKKKDPLFEVILSSHFDLLQKNNLKEIARKTQYPIETIRKVVNLIKEFDPKPGRNFSDEYTPYVVPDVYVVKTENGFEIFLNDEDIPDVTLNRYYIELYSKKKVNAETKKYIKHKIRQGEWFIKSLQQRQRTLYLTAKSIVKFQEDFFEGGIKHLKPLILRDVAQDIGVHESTVSRITTNKYISTSHGIFEMKFFFPTGIEKNDGNVLSTDVVMALISEIIHKEDKTRPLTDDRIVMILGDEHNIRIARRTVAKYREILNILSSKDRRVAL